MNLYYISVLRPPITSKRHDIQPRNFARRSVYYVAGTWASSDVAQGSSAWENFTFLNFAATPFKPQQSCAQWLAVTAYRRHHYGDASSALQRMLERRECCWGTWIELRPEGPKIEAAGRYYGKDQADRSACFFFIKKSLKALCIGLLNVFIVCNLSRMIASRWLHYVGNAR